MNKPIRTLLSIALIASWTGCQRAEPGSTGGDTSAKKVAPVPPPPNSPLAGACPRLITPQPGDNWARIQAAIDAGKDASCNEVLLGAGEFEISRPLQLRSGLRLSGQRWKRSFSTLRPSREFSGAALLLTKLDVEASERKQMAFYVEDLHFDAKPSCPSNNDCPDAKVQVGIWLENPAYPTIRDCDFTRFPESGAGIRGGGVLYLKLLDNRFIGMLGWSVDLDIAFCPKKPNSNKHYGYYAVSVGTIQRNYFAGRRGLRLTPGFAVTIRDNQFEGGLSMIHAYESASSVLIIENNYFELSRTPQDVPEHGSISVKGTGRIVGNLLIGPAKGKLGQYPGPGIEVLSSASMTIEDNTIRRFDPGVKVAGVKEPRLVRDRGNVIAPKTQVDVPWDFPGRRAEPADDANDDVHEGTNDDANAHDWVLPQ